ncbi:MAG: aminotransferase class V-fold PLP-dependent enzyme, partial [Caulobacteraceae bacterium]
LIFKEGVSGVRILHGAGQERGLRAGTENVPGIAGFGVAADSAARDLETMASHVGWRDAVEARVKAAGATIIGGAVARLPNTLFMAVEGWDSPQQLITLDLAGVMVSAGSACSSGKVKPSKTISAMGLKSLATGGVRVSGGWGTIEGDWVRFADAWVAAYNKHKTRAAERVREVA